VQNHRDGYKDWDGAKTSSSSFLEQEIGINKCAVYVWKIINGFRK
jgi:hypothetical protein